jgi:hypothetical protein
MAVAEVCAEQTRERRDGERHCQANHELHISR